MFFHRAPIPATVDVLQKYIQLLCNSFTSVVTVRNYFSGVITLHNLLGQPCPDPAQFCFVYLFKGASRIMARTPQRATPLTPDVLIAIYSRLNISDPCQAAFWSALLLGFFLFLRISNLLPKSVASYNPFVHLSRSDIVLMSDQMVVRFNWTKTIQVKEREFQLNVVAMPNTPLCPLSAYKNHILLSPSSNMLPAFCYSSSTGVKVLCQNQFITMLRCFTSDLCKGSKSYSGHSMRRGGATLAFEAGVPSELIKIQGDWKSSAYLSYLQPSLSKKSKTTQLMYNHLCKS